MHFKKKKKLVSGTCNPNYIINVLSFHNHRIHFSIYKFMYFPFKLSTE